MSRGDLQATGPGAAVALDPDRGPGLTVQFAGPEGPTVVCDLAGRVSDGTARADGRELSFGLEPAPDAELPGHGPLRLDVSIVVDADQPAATLTIDAPQDYPFERLVAPGRFRLPGKSARPWHFLIPLAEGVSVPASAASQPDSPGALLPEVDLFGNWISLPLIGLTRGRGAEDGGLLIMSPQGDDHTVGLLSQEGDDGPGFELIQNATLGRFGYRRVWRLVWTPRPGLVELAATIRRELRATGLRLDPLPSKLAERGMSPSLIESVGGTHLWWHVDPIPSWLPERLRSDGVRSVVLMGPPDAEAAQQAARSEMVAGTYFMSSDIYPPGVIERREWRNIFPPEGFTEGWPDQLARSREGWLLPNWVHTPSPTATNLWEDEEFLTEHGTVGWRPRAAQAFHPTQGYQRCPHFHEETVRSSALPVMDRIGASGVLCDVTTAVGPIECHAPDHPCDRRTDKRLRQEELGLLGAGGRFVSSECGMWWALDVADAFEGSLKYEGNLNNRVLGDYAFRPEWWGAEFNLEYRVPLLGLVARHSVVRTMWWGHGHDRHPETWDAKDALCAVYGASPIFVADPAHPLDPGTPKWERFLQTARAFDLLRRLTFGQGITSYEVLGQHVAVTEFEDGTEVRANVGPTDQEDLAAGSFEIRDAGGDRVWPTGRIR